MTFNILSHQGGVLNNVGRDRRSECGQHGIPVRWRGRRGSRRAATSAPAPAGLPGGRRAERRQQVDEVEQAAAGAEPTVSGRRPHRRS
jgi:hypothetical protein